MKDSLRFEWFPGNLSRKGIPSFKAMLTCFMKSPRKTLSARLDSSLFYPVMNHYWVLVLLDILG